MLISIIYFFFTGWWLILQLSPASNYYLKDLFSDTYGIIAILGGVGGLMVSRKWGGTKSYLGKSIILFSLGLLAQALGQVSYSVYHYLFHIEAPYPSVGDVGFFGSIPLYIYGVVLLGKISGVKISWKLFLTEIESIIIPLALLISAYVLFLQNYTINLSEPLVTFLDFGYPLGEAIYLSLTLIVYMRSRKVLGGIMRGNVLFILFALCAQFLADYVFLYKFQNNTWVGGGINDFMYLTAYFLMSLALLQLNVTYKKIGNQ